jgi:hypothetical protein
MGGQAHQRRRGRVSDCFVFWGGLPRVVLMMHQECSSLHTKRHSHANCMRTTRTNNAQERRQGGQEELRGVWTRRFDRTFLFLDQDMNTYTAVCNYHILSISWAHSAWPMARAAMQGEGRSGCAFLGGASVRVSVFARQSLCAPQAPTYKYSESHLLSKPHICHSIQYAFVDYTPRFFEPLSRSPGVPELSRETPWT